MNLKTRYEVWEINFKAQTMQIHSLHPHHSAAADFVRDAPFSWDVQYLTRLNSNWENEEPLNIGVLHDPA